MLLAYIKRRNNLIFIVEKNRKGAFTGRNKYNDKVEFWKGNKMKKVVGKTITLKAPVADQGC